MLSLLSARVSDVFGFADTERWAGSFGYFLETGGQSDLL